MDECKPLAPGRPSPRKGHDRRHPGKAVQVDPIKPTLKAPGIQLLNLTYDIPLSNFAFKFNLRRYILGVGSHTLGLPKAGWCML